MVFSAEFQPKVGQEFWDRVRCEALKRLGTQSKLWTISIGQLITRETLQSQLHRWRHQIQATSWGGDKARTYYTGNCLVVNPKVTVNAKIIILFFSLLSLATLSQLLAWETRSVLITTSYLIETYLQISLLEFFSPPSSQGLLPLIPSLPPEPSSWSHSSVFWWLASEFARGDRACADQGTIAAIQNDAAGGMVISGTHRTGRRMRRGHPEQEAGHRADQRPHRPDEHPGPDGAREVKQ